MSWAYWMYLVYKQVLNFMWNQIKQFDQTEGKNEFYD